MASTTSSNVINLSPQLIKFSNALHSIFCVLFGNWCGIFIYPVLCTALHFSSGGYRGTKKRQTEIKDAVRRQAGHTRNVQFTVFPSQTNLFWTHEFLGRVRINSFPKYSLITCYRRHWFRWTVASQPSSHLEYLVTLGGSQYFRFYTCYRTNNESGKNISHLWLRTVPDIKPHKKYITNVPKSFIILKEMW